MADICEAFGVTRMTYDYSSPLAAIGVSRIGGPAAQWTSGGCRWRVPGGPARRREHAPRGLGLYLRSLDVGASGGALQRRLGGTRPRSASEFICARWGTSACPKHTLKGRRGEAEHRKAKRELERLKGAKRKNATYEVIFLDEARFYLNPHLARAWHRRGSELRVPCAGQEPAGGQRAGRATR